MIVFLYSDIPVAMFLILLISEIYIDDFIIKASAYSVCLTTKLSNHNNFDSNFSNSILFLSFKKKISCIILVCGSNMVRRKVGIMFSP